MQFINMFQAAPHRFGFQRWCEPWRFYSKRIQQLQRSRFHFTRRVRRAEEQTSTSADKASRPSVASFPRPAWLSTYFYPLGAPFRTYHRWTFEHPYKTQIGSSLIIWFLGDLSAQYIQQFGSSESPGRALVENYDGKRSLRAIIIGGLFAIPGYHWFMFLSLNFNVPKHYRFSHVLSLGIKLIINQIVFAPSINTYFFGMQALLSGAGGPDTSQNQDLTLSERLAIPDRLAAAWDRIQRTVPTSWYNSFFFWPFVMAFSFTFVPMRMRQIFGGTAGLVWQSYLGLVNQRAMAKKREMAHA